VTTQRSSTSGRASKTLVKRQDAQARCRGALPYPEQPTACSPYGTMHRLTPGRDFGSAENDRLEGDNDAALEALHRKVSQLKQVGPPRVVHPQPRGAESPIVVCDSRPYQVTGEIHIEVGEQNSMLDRMVRPPARSPGPPVPRSPGPPVPRSPGVAAGPVTL
jgi:hypothetical protein